MGSCATTRSRLSAQIDREGRSRGAVEAIVCAGLLVFVRKAMNYGPFKKIWSPEDLKALDG